MVFVENNGKTEGIMWRNNTNKLKLLIEHSLLTVRFWLRLAYTDPSIELCDCIAVDKDPKHHEVAFAPTKDSLVERDRGRP